jgi:hypothetical protein
MSLSTEAFAHNRRYNTLSRLQQKIRSRDLDPSIGASRNGPYSSAWKSPKINKRAVVRAVRQKYLF